MDEYTGYAYTLVVTPPTPALSGTVFSVGDASAFPEMPFLASVWPSGAIQSPGNTETVLVTGEVAGVLTVVRAQVGSSAIPIATGFQFATGGVASHRSAIALLSGATADDDNTLVSGKL